MSRPNCDIAAPDLAAQGHDRIEWAGGEMPVLARIRERFAREKPLEGLRVGGCLHITSETANLALTLQAGGTEVALCASNPLSTQDDVAAALETLAKSWHRPRPHVTEYQLRDGRCLRLLAEGRLVNLAAAEGHPAAVMDMSFANQALVVEYLWRQPERLPVAVHPVPREIDENVAHLKLQALNIAIDTLTTEQQAYLASWQEVT